MIEIIWLTVANSKIQEQLRTHHNRTAHQHSSISMAPATMKIPVIDISSYLDGSNPKDVAKQIGDACEEIGFFMIKGHGIPLSLLKQVHCEATVFFDQPLETKQKTMAPFGLGYMGQGTENVAATLKESTVQDQKESLNINLPVRENVWPQDMPSLSDTCKEYYTKVDKLASQLMRLFALALDLDETFFDDKVNNAFTVLRLLNYPEQPNAVAPDASQMKTMTAEHTDYGTLTILWSPDSRGLQAKSRQDKWIDVISPIDHFIINIGDLMSNWTNDKWVSTLHRVVTHPETLGKRRMSLPFFHNPNPVALIECIPGCFSEDNPAKYDPIVAKEHMEMKVSKALGKEEKMD